MFVADYMIGVCGESGEVEREMIFNRTASLRSRHENLFEADFRGLSSIYLVGTSGEARCTLGGLAGFF